MLVEIALFVGNFLFGTVCYIHDCRKTVPSVVLQPRTQLIIELLRNDEAAWVQYLGTLVHPSGVRLLQSTQVYVRLLEDGKYLPVDTPREDEIALSREIRNYENRKRDNRERALTRAFAERVRNGTSVLGGSDASSGVETSNTHEADTTGLLSYDQVRQQVVFSVSGDTVRLDDNLAERYDLSIKNRKVVPIPPRGYYVQH